MFSLREFIKKGFLNAVGKMADYQVILNAAGWYDKGALMESDLAEIQAAIDAHNAAATVSQDADNGEQTAADSPQDADNADAPSVPG